MKVTFEKPRKIRKDLQSAIIRKANLYKDDINKLLDELNYQYHYKNNGVIFGRGGSHIWGKELKDGILQSDRIVFIEFTEDLK